MRLLISQSGVASTLIRNFSDITRVDFKNLPLDSLAYLRLDRDYEDSTLVLFPQPDLNSPAHSITQLDFAGLSSKLGLTDLRERDIFYFQHVKDLLRSVQDAKSIYIVHNSEVYHYER
jgi:hypothetical protein